MKASTERVQVELSPPDPHPFVKWAGGKGTLVGEIAARIPHHRRYERYVEPFVGAGAVFFWVRRSFPALVCEIGDGNEELVNAYQTVRDRPLELIAKLETHAALHDKDHYYAVRALRLRSPAERAARFIYLNRTCFNGLYRVNRRGEFNVPMGRYERPRIADRENLLAVSSALEGVSILHADFETLLASCGREHLVYLDPPYDPLSETSQFTSYTASGFGREDQQRLAAAFERLARRGATVLLSNSSTEFVRELYGALDPRPAMDVVEVPRSINAKGTKRGPVAELLIHYHP
jgi:DNA adenine methylase